jgi:4-amino-4-deoxy-L-arabinose transferase-like glycosyltransferase
MEIISLEEKQRNRMYLLVIFLSSVIFFIPNLGKVHLFDWDEINFAESAREMIVTHK